MKGIPRRWWWVLFLGLLAVLALGVRHSVAEPPAQAEALPPEPFPFSDRYPAEVELDGPAGLALLVGMEIDVGGVRALDGTYPQPEDPAEPLVATVYINDAEAQRLEAAGLAPRVIPNESLRAWQRYGPGTEGPEAWPTFEEFVTRMEGIAAAYPNLVRMVSIGQSVQGRDLWLLKISDNPDLEEDEPEFRYTSTMHGNEGVGTELTLRLAELLTANYGVDPALTALVDEMEIWLLPIHNPDGYVAGSRFNAHGVDLNRDFPDRITEPIDDPAGREPETQAVMYFGYDHRFVMGANYHTGTYVVNVPWDSIPAVPDHAPDEAAFLEWGMGYAWRNPDIWNGPFPNGVTLGWEWYIIRGGMQDWAYHWHGEHHVTIEVSYGQPPPYNQMDDYWDANREAMLWWMGRALTGARGRVYDAVSGDPLDALVDVVQIGKPVRTDPDVGDYHRLLLPGAYTLTCTADGYLEQAWSIVVVSGTATFQDCALLRDVELAVVAGDSQAAGAPGETVTHTFAITNVGTVTDTYDLAVTPGAWPAVLLDAQVGPLGPSESGQARVAVDIPAEPARAAAIASDTLTLYVTSVTSPSVGAEGEGLTLAMVEPGLDLFPNTSSQMGAAGEVISYLLAVENTGTYTDVYTLTWAGNTWPVQVAPTQTWPLAPGGMGKVAWVQVEIPAGAAVPTDTVTVRATSRWDAGVYDEVTLVTRRVWPVYLPLVSR